MFAKSAIQAEIARIRAKAELLSGGAVLTLVEKRKFVARLLRSNLSTFDAEVDGDLLQEVSDTEFGKKIKLCGKMEAIKLDNDLAGEGSEAKGNAGIAGLLTKLRK